jgi:hypothetical protein
MSEQLLDRILPHLKVERGPDARGEYTCWCIFHPDGQGQPPHRPNLHVSERGYKCYACGAKGGLRGLAEHLDITLETKKKRWDSPEAFGAWYAKKNRRLSGGVWKYLDSNGEDIMAVLRFDPGDKNDNRGKDYKPMHKVSEGWIVGDPKKPLPLYCLPEILNNNSETVYVTEGEKAADAGRKIGLLTTTSSHGVDSPGNTDWSPLKGKNIIILPDNDGPGRRYARSVAKLLKGTAASIKIVELPGLPESGDLVEFTDPFTGRTPEKAKAEIEHLAAETPIEFPPVDTSQFKPMTVTELTQILGLTIKQDETNKVITFLCELSAFTDSAQFNISFNAPSSTGKSYIPLEIAGLFPAEDVVSIGYCSPTAFFHDWGVFIREERGYRVDLSRKILIFLDQPHTLLLQHLRPLLSHDKKEISLKITDKSQKYGLKTKNIFLIGFPSVIFCTAGLQLDEQEATRFLLLSPQMSQEKLQEAVRAKILRESDIEKYRDWLDSDPTRQALKNRIQAVKEAGITDVKIPSPDKIEERFREKHKHLKPRDTRDIGRILSLVKSLTLLNLFFRERSETVIFATEEDVDAAFALWETISESQEFNLPPYVFDLFYNVIVAAYQEKQAGLTKQDIFRKHFQVHRRYLPDWQLRKEIIPMLEAAGLVNSEPDLADKRRILYYPTVHSPISSEENNIGD